MSVFRNWTLAEHRNSVDGPVTAVNRNAAILLNRLDLIDGAGPKLPLKWVTLLQRSI